MVPLLTKGTRAPGWRRFAACLLGLLCAGGALLLYLHARARLATGLILRTTENGPGNEETARALEFLESYWLLANHFEGFTPESLAFLGVMLCIVLAGLLTLSVRRGSTASWFVLSLVCAGALGAVLWWRLA